MNLPAAGVLGVLASLLVGAGLLAPQAEAQSADVTLRAGWNNVVYAGERLPVEEALGAAAEAVDAVWHWEAASQGWESWFRAAPSLATLEELEPGEAYWLRADREVTWAQPARAEAEALLAVETASGAVRIVRVELADTAGERARGLMFRESLRADVGMPVPVRGGHEGRVLDGEHAGAAVDRVHRPRRRDHRHPGHGAVDERAAQPRRGVSLGVRG